MRITKPMYTSSKALTHIGEESFLNADLSQLIHIVLCVLFAKSVNHLVYGTAVYEMAVCGFAVCEALYERATSARDV